MAGTQILHYTVIKEFDDGAFGRSIKAIDNKTNRLVALKFPPREFLADFVMRKAEWKRFVDDMNTSQSFQNPFSCNVIESSEIDGNFFYVTDFIEGVNLRELLEFQIPQIRLTLTIIEKVLQVFDIIHPKDVTIGSLRTDHIILTPDGKIKLLDLPTIRMKDFAILHNESDHLLSLAFQAPEILKKEPIDGRSDLYSLGVILFQLVTGKLPFTGRTMDDLIYTLMYTEAPSIATIAPGIPPDVGLIVKRLLSKSPAWRYPHASDLSVEIKRLMTTLGFMGEAREKQTAEAISNLVTIIQKQIEQLPPNFPMKTMDQLLAEPTKPALPKYEVPKTEPPKPEIPILVVQKPEIPEPKKNKIETPKTKPPKIEPSPPEQKKSDVQKPQPRELLTDDIIRRAEEEARKAAFIDAIIEQEIPPDIGQKSSPPSQPKPPVTTPPISQPTVTPPPVAQPPVIQPPVPPQVASPPVRQLPHLPMVEEFIVPPIAEGETEERKLSSIVFTDIRGFSKKMGENETIAMRVLQLHNSIMESLFSKYNGKVIKSIGDAYMVDFSSAVNAVRCAVEAQEKLWEYNRSQRTELERVFVRIGIHMGDVVIKGNDIFGDAVNIAARVEATGEAGRISISSDVYQQVRNKMPLDVLYLGKRQLKNIQEPIEVYQIMLNTIPETLPTPEELRHAQQMEDEEKRRQEDERRRREEEALRNTQDLERRKRELEEQRRAEEELRRRRQDEDRRRKEEESRLKRKEEERRAALRRAISVYMQAANDYLSVEQFDRAAEEITRAYKLDPKNEDVRLMENRLRIAQEEARLRLEARTRRDEEERRRRDAEDARRKAEEEAQRLAAEEDKRRKEELEKREAHLKKIAEYLEKGELYLREGDLEKARNELSRIYILDPGNAAARIFEVKIKDIENQQVREREEQESQRRTEEEDARRKRERENQIMMFVVRAQDFYRKHRFDEALDEIVHIYAIDPANPQARQWEEKIRVAQENQRKTNEMLGIIGTDRGAAEEGVVEVPEDVVSEPQTTEIRQEVKHPLAISRWLAIAIGAALVIIIIGVISRPLLHRLFPTQYVVAIQSFSTEGVDTETGRGLAVLLAGDLAVVPHIRIINPMISGIGKNASPSHYIQKFHATHLISGTVKLDKNQIEITMNIADSSMQLSNITVVGQLEALATLRQEMRAAVAEAFDLSGDLDNLPVMSSTSSRDAIEQFFIGITNIQEHSIKNAIAAFETSVTSDPRFAEANAWLARTLLDSCEVLGTANNDLGSRAFEAAEKAIELHPQSVIGIVAHATYYRLVARFSEARSSALDALQISSSNSDAHAELAIASIIHNDFSTASDHIRSALWLDPYSYRAWLASALSNHYQQKFKDAARDYQRAIETQPVHECETTVCLMADALNRADMNELAISTYTALLTKSPDDYFMLYRLGRIYQGIGRRYEGDQYLEKALKIASASLEKNSGDAQSRMMVGLSTMRLGKFVDGFAEVQRVATANPENPTFLYALARAYAIYNKNNEALDALSKAVDKEYRIGSVLDLDLFNLESNERFPKILFLQETPH
jgi:class 3 adenylate cyclase/serine/threonine protein kinase/Flp pilus assembly protein TadD